MSTDLEWWIACTPRDERKEIMSTDQWTRHAQAVLFETKENQYVPNSIAEVDGGESQAGDRQDEPRQEDKKS
jgi:hypothetical protein